VLEQSWLGYKDCDLGKTLIKNLFAELDQKYSNSFLTIFY